MVTEKFEPPDLQKFIASLGLNADPLKAPWRRPEPELLPVPAAVRGFRIRVDLQGTKPDDRSEERRVGKECRSRWSPYH